MVMVFGRRTPRLEPTNATHTPRINLQGKKERFINLASQLGTPSSGAVGLAELTLVGHLCPYHLLGREPEGFINPLGGSLWCPDRCPEHKRSLTICFGWK